MRVRDIIRELPASRIAEVLALEWAIRKRFRCGTAKGTCRHLPFIGAAGTAALQTGHTFYTYKAGLPELRTRIADV